MDPLKPHQETQDLKKYFDPKSYATVFVDSTGFKTQHHELVEHIETLQSIKVNSEEYHALLQQLKQQYTIDDFYTLCEQSSSDAFTAHVLRIIWECNCESSSKAMELLPYVCSKVFSVAFEALTVFQEAMSELQPEQLENLKTQYKTLEHSGIVSIETDFKTWLQNPI
jgi:hypothetical protein